MSSADIVRDIRTLTQTKLLTLVSKKWLHQFHFGINAFGLRPFQSAGSNARTVVANPCTAATKADRLLSNSGLAEQLASVCDGLGVVKPGSFVNIDHSDMHGLTALVGAVQTRKGRAIPCMVETTYALQIPAHSKKPKLQALRSAMKLARKSQSFTGHTIDALQTMADRLGFWPKLVFDRGFGNESIIDHLQAEGAVLYIRVKAGRFVEFDGERTEIKQLKEKDATIQLFGMTLRVIRSPKSRRAKEPWYILTNDTHSSRTKIVRIYYHRFEIEETFKDMKHIWELKRTRLVKPNSLKIILWFACLGIALLYIVTKPTKQSIQISSSKKQTSWLRQAHEQLSRAYGRLLWDNWGEVCK
jgi:Transposase DDE domain